MGHSDYFGIHDPIHPTHRPNWLLPMTQADTSVEDKKMLEWMVIETNKVVRKWKVCQDPKLQNLDNLRSVALNFLQRAIKHFNPRCDPNYRRWQIVASSGKPQIFFNLAVPCVTGIVFPGPMYFHGNEKGGAQSSWNKLAESLNYTLLGLETTEAQEPDSKPFEINNLPVLNLSAITNIKF